MDEQIQSRGIHNLDEALDFGKSVIEAIETSKADGKIDIKDDFINFVTPLTKLPRAITGGDEIPAELLDVDDEEYQQLKAKYGDLIDDPDWQELIRGILITARSARNIVIKRRDAQA